MTNDYTINGRPSSEWTFRDFGSLVVYFHRENGDIGCAFKHVKSENMHRNLVISSQRALERLMVKTLRPPLTTNPSDIALIAQRILLAAKEDHSRGDLNLPWYPAANQAQGYK